MPNVDNFRLDSDYPMDKIVYFKQGTFTPSSGSFSFSHGLNFTPLLFGVISKTSDFAETYSFNSPLAEPPQSEVTTFAPQGITLFSNSTTVYFWVQNQGSLSGTWYYRIYGFSDENTSTVTASETSTSGGNLILNSDYNYYKLYEAGSVEYSGSQSATINHNLGYRPFVLAWGRMKAATQEFPADITQVIYTADDGDSESDKISIYVDSTKLVINCLSDSLLPISRFNKVWYRIYANAT